MRFFSHFPKILFLSLYLIICAPYLSACAYNPVEIKCIEYRAVFDVGSETTKMKVSKIDKCMQKNIGFIYSKDIKVPYAENLVSGVLSDDIRSKGIIALKALKKEAVEAGAQTFTGVATEALRQAFNTPEFLQEIKAQTGIPVKLISPDKEAILGYLATVSVLGSKAKNAVVWDIGGNSMQMVFRRSDQHYIIYHGNLASITFKKKILSEIKNKKLIQGNSPNPIGKDDLERALKIAMLAAAEVPEEIKQKLQKPDTFIIGIGGVHNQSINKQLGSKNIYRREELIDVLNYRINLTDRDIGGHYADTEVSNLILVLGFMKQLVLNEIIPVNVNLADGIFFDPTFW
jgi:exopolyphosphatase/guanosine-5'-triphosphate,3'-diphosphate pyrophosphatase